MIIQKEIRTENVQDHKVAIEYGNIRSSVLIES